ncbi:MAG TPA: TolC family protein, partial [Novosphingobium sp.]|nr:TolC family protein [Novosphingobium sp.]
TAKVGVAAAGRLPTVKFTGFLGLGGSHPGDVVDVTSLTTVLAPQISWNFLDFGGNLAKLRQARGGREEAEAKYREAVLAALRDAEDSLARYGAARTRLASALASRQEAVRLEALASARFAAGTATRADALKAERDRLAADQSVAEAEAELTGAYVVVQKALGLGWQ